MTIYSHLGIKTTISLKELEIVKILMNLSLNFILSRYQFFLFDCDGTLWIQGDALPGVSKFLNALRESGKFIYFISNNSTVIPEHLIQTAKLCGFVVYNDEIISSGVVLENVIKAFSCKEGSLIPPPSFLKLPSIKRAFVMGEEALFKGLQNLGIEVVGGPYSV
jgi:ribonucleotide monophosphatase NagD (HAD superfamily)